MSKIMHPIEPEELMAYLDGELSAERAAETAAHLAECTECKGIVDGLRRVSQRVHAWEIEFPEQKTSHAIADALQQVRAIPAVATVSRRTWRHRFNMSRLSPAWIGGVAAIVVVVASSVSFMGRHQNGPFQQVASQMEQGPISATRQLYISRSAGDGNQDRLQEFARLQAPPAASGEGHRAGKAATAAGGLTSPEPGLNLTSGPMVIRTAALSLTTKDFDKVRARLEEILKRHRGYIGELKVGGATRSGRILTSTLRVPADQLDGTLTELKTLGRVESESQGGQDVTSQYVDLQARLENARNTEKRLTDLLGQRTGKLSDVLEVEQEVDRVRGEIERMEAERKNMSNQVSFATLNVSVSEEYKAQLEAVPPSTATRLSNAAVEGYRSLVDGVVDVILFLLSNGPSWLFWGALLFVPARFAWKTMRRRYAE